MRLDFLCFKFDSFDRLSFSQEALSFSNNSMVLFYNFHEINLGHKPEGIKRFPTNIKFPLPKNKRMHQIFFPFISGLHIIMMTSLFFYLCLRYRPKVVWAESPWAGLPFALARKLKLCEKFIFCGADWLITNQKRSLTSHIGINIIWIYSDLICSRSCDLLISYTEKIKNSRIKYWGKPVGKLEHIQFPPTLKIHPKAKVGKRLNICYMGQIRKESGFEVIIPLLPLLNKKYGIKLKVIGPSSPLHDELIDFAKKSGKEKYVDFYQWVDSDKIHEVMSECFCGINFLTATDYSNNTIPGKLMHYLQMLMPPLITWANGPYSKVIEKNSLGIAIEPTKNELNRAIENLFKYQTAFQENIINLISKQDTKTVTDYVNIINNQKVTN